MKILIFGATGSTGKYLVELALSKGYKLSLFVRNPSKVKYNNSDLEIVKGDATNKNDIFQIIPNYDVIISLLGTPFGKKPICGKAIGFITQSMKPSQKIIAVSAFGTRETRKGLYSFISWLSIPSNMRDKTEMEEIIERSNRNFTVIRPTKLTKGKLRKNYKINPVKIGLFPTISMNSVSDLILTSIETEKYNKEFITITN